MSGFPWKQPFGKYTERKVRGVGWTRELDLCWTGAWREGSVKLRARGDKAGRGLAARDVGHQPHTLTGMSLQDRGSGVPVPDCGE